MVIIVGDGRPQSFWTAVLIASELQLELIGALLLKTSGWELIGNVFLADQWETTAI